jgi:hypothetical protein
MNSPLTSSPLGEARPLGFVNRGKRTTQGMASLLKKVEFFFLEKCRCGSERTEYQK